MKDNVENIKKSFLTLAGVSMCFGIGARVRYLLYVTHNTSTNLFSLGTYNV